jgi:tetratricopeptide (TPR) repeat protein
LCPFGGRYSTISARFSSFPKVSSVLRFIRATRRPNPIVLADHARDARQWDAAARYYRTALARDPYNPSIWVQYGHALKESGSHPAAEAAYRRAIADDPAAADPYLQLGHVLKLGDRIEEAKAAYLRALALDPSLAEATRELAALGCSATDLPQLLRVVPAPVAANSGRAAGWRRRRKESTITRADRARDLGQWEIAARLYRRALDRNPDTPPIWIQYGHMLMEAGARGAEWAYDQALAYDPGLTEANLELGRVLDLRGAHAQAEAAYLRAVARDQSASGPLEGLSRLGWSRGQLAELRGMLTADGQAPPLSTVPACAAELQRTNCVGVLGMGICQIGELNAPLAAAPRRRAVGAQPTNYRPTRR